MQNYLKFDLTKTRRNVGGMDKTERYSSSSSLDSAILHRKKVELQLKQ